MQTVSDSPELDIAPSCCSRVFGALLSSIAERIIEAERLRSSRPDTFLPFAGSGRTEAARPDAKGFQLVLQVPFSGAVAEYDSFIEVEQEIENSDIPDVDVDGHDAGAGEMNIFVHTNDPKKAFQAISGLAGVSKYLAKLRAAFRRFDDESEEYTILWPLTLEEFSVT